MAKDNGGPAFPIPHSEKWEPENGMSLRDWFAGQALASTEWYQTDCTVDEIAYDCYKYADEMIKQRGKIDQN